MAHSNKTIALLLGSLFTLAACGGGAAGSDEPPAASAADSGAGSTAPSAPPPATPVSGANGADGGADGAAAATPIAKHCKGDVVAPDVCIENAQGRAGDVVDVDVVLLSNPTCGAAGEASGHVVFDVTKLHVENELDRIDCRLRLLGPDVDGKTDLAWQAFGGGSFPGCVADVPAGKADTIKIKIAAGTPPGDYPLTWSNAGLIGHMNAPVECTTIGQGIPGTLRVLP